MKYDYRPFPFPNDAYEKISHTLTSSFYSDGEFLFSGNPISPQSAFQFDSFKLIFDCTAEQFRDIFWKGTFSFIVKDMIYVNRVRVAFWSIERLEPHFVSVEHHIATPLLLVPDVRFRGILYLSGNRLPDFNIILALDGTLHRPIEV